jgi:hypothetical protein
MSVGIQRLRADRVASFAALVCAELSRRADFGIFSCQAQDWVGIGHDAGEAMQTSSAFGTVDQ